MILILNLLSIFSLALILLIFWYSTIKIAKENKELKNRIEFLEKYNLAIRRELKVPEGEDIFKFIRKKD